MQHHDFPCGVDKCKFPCARLIVGSRAVSCWRLTGAIGLVCGSIVAMGAGTKSGLSPLTVLSIDLLICAICIGYAFFRRKLVGAETHTLLEIFAFALTTMFAVTWLAGLPALAHLDATVTGTCVLVAIGRVGCLSAGCCYGVKADIGFVYPHECGGDGKTRRFPVQALDAAVWVLLACLSWALVGHAKSGLPLATVLLGYGVARYSMEFLRGDRRPRWRGRSISQWLSLVAIVGGGILGQQLRGWSVGEGVLAAAGLATWILLSRMGATWLQPEPSLEQLDGLGSVVKEWLATCPRQVSTAQLGPYKIGALCVEATGKWTLSLSCADPSCTFAEARLVLGAIAERLGCELEGATISRSRSGVFFWQESDSLGYANPRPYTRAW